MTALQNKTISSFANSAILLKMKSCKKMVLFDKLELCRFLKKKFLETGKEAIELKEFKLYHGYQNIVKIVNSDGKKGSISDSKLEAFAKYLGYIINTVYDVKEENLVNEKKLENLQVIDNKQNKE